MIGRVEITEILGMVGTCAALLFAGFAVETMDGDVQPAWAVSGADIEAPRVPADLELPDEITREAPNLEAPVHPSVPAPVPIVLALPDACDGPCDCVVLQLE